MNLLSKTSFLVFIARLKPEIYDALLPKGPNISEPTRHVMASMIIKHIAKEVKDADVSKELNKAGKSLFDSNIKSLYDDDLWYVWPFPKPNWKEIFHLSPHPEPWFENFGIFPQPWRRTFGEEVMLNPQPLPPRELPYYGAILIQLADAVSLKDTAEVLHNIGHALMNAPSKK